MNPDVASIIWVTLEVTFWSTLVATAIGLPLAIWIGVFHFRGRRAVLTLANAGLGLPPVVVGLVLALLFFRGAPLGGLELIYTRQGIIVAQTILALPAVVALGSAALVSVDRPLLEQARGLGASGYHVARLAISEARVGIVAAVITAMGAALSEVGAVVLVGGNIEGETQTLASALLVQVSAGEYATALAVGAILLGLILVLAGSLSLLQRGEPSDRRIHWRLP